MNQLEQLYNLLSAIQTEEFEKLVLTPLREKKDSLKYAYQCDSLRELYTLKGKHTAYREALNLLDKENIAKRIEHLKGSQAG